jgi:hypothetical protein
MVRTTFSSSTAASLGTTTVFGIQMSVDKDLMIIVPYDAV